MTIWHWVCLLIGGGIGWGACQIWQRHVALNAFIAKFEAAGASHLAQLEALVRRL